MEYFRSVNGIVPSPTKYEYVLKIQVFQLSQPQVIQLVVCYMNVNCDKSSLDYYDGDDLRFVSRRYCGLKQLALPRSSSNVAIVQTWKEILNELANEVRIQYKSEPASSPSNGKYVCL